MLSFKAINSHKNHTLISYNRNIPINIFISKQGVGYVELGVGNVELGLGNVELELGNVELEQSNVELGVGNFEILGYNLLTHLQTCRFNDQIIKNSCFMRAHETCHATWQQNLRMCGFEMTETKIIRNVSLLPLLPPYLSL